jgi:hypothetical protein
MNRSTRHSRGSRAAAHQDFASLEETLHVAIGKPTWLRPEHRVGERVLKN